MNGIEVPGLVNVLLAGPGIMDVLWMFRDQTVPKKRDCWKGKQCEECLLTHKASKSVQLKKYKSFVRPR